MNTDQEIQDMDQLVLKKILKLVHQHTGITMEERKKNLIQGRLRPRLRQLSFLSYAEYVSYLEFHPEEIQEFINLVTTNETSFFRTARIWNYFETGFLPRWFAQHPGQKLQVWSAACATGEEAYSLAICCQEFKLKNPAFKFKIFGSDVDTSVLSYAEKGEYQGRSISSFHSTHKILCEKYLTISEDGNYRVIDELRKNIKFQSHNLFQGYGQVKYFDVIFLRNVLIYFSVQDQEKVLNNISRALAPEGNLILGESESLLGLKTDFKYQAPLI